MFVYFLCFNSVWHGGYIWKLWDPLWSKKRHMGLILLWWIRPIFCLVYIFYYVNKTLPLQSSVFQLFGVFFLPGSAESHESSTVVVSPYYPSTTSSSINISELTFVILLGFAAFKCRPFCSQALNSLLTAECLVECVTGRVRCCQEVYAVWEKCVCECEWKRACLCVC